jgi:hypothetical protein
MSFDCRYKCRKDYCRKRKAECKPQSRDCVLYGRFQFAQPRDTGERTPSPRPEEQSLRGEVED